MSTGKMARIIVTATGWSRKSCKYIEEEIPEPGPGEVRVKVLAAGVSFADVLMRRGLYPGTPPPPFTPGYDIVGEVDEARRREHRHFALGQRVGAMIVRGGYSQYAIVPRRITGARSRRSRSRGSGLPDSELHYRLSNAASHRPRQ